jgi:hypothetical protein
VRVRRPRHRLHRCPTTPPEGHCQRTRRLVEPVAAGLAHRAQALSVCSTPLRPKDGLDVHKPRAAGVAHASALRESRSTARRLSLSRESRSGSRGETLLFQSSEWLTGHIPAYHSLDGSRGGLTTYTGGESDFRRARRPPRRACCPTCDRSLVSRHLLFAQSGSEAYRCSLWCAGSAPTDGVQPPFGQPQCTTRETPEQRPLASNRFGTDRGARFQPRRCWT